MNTLKLQNALRSETRCLPRGPPHQLKLAVVDFHGQEAATVTAVQQVFVPGEIPLGHHQRAAHQVIRRPIRNDGPRTQAIRAEISGIRDLGKQITCWLLLVINLTRLAEAI